MHQRLFAMMTKEEVAQVIAYCDENKISYKQRLSELGVNPWSFYDATADILTALPAIPSKR